MQFQSSDHKYRFLWYTLRKKISRDDHERLAMFYCLTASEEISETIHRVYDYKYNEIVLYRQEDSGGEKIYTICQEYSVVDKALIRLAFNLYNGYVDARTNPHSLYADNPNIIKVMGPALEVLYKGLN